MPRYSETSIRILRNLRARILISSFGLPTNGVYRAVHYFRDNEFFFADYSREFFENLHQLIKRGRITHIKRLLVFDNDEEAGTPESRRIIEFHRSNPGYDYRLVSSLDWEDLLAGASLDRSLDIGIFGERRAYRAPRNRPDFVVGTWTSNRKEVHTLINLFEEGWIKGRVPPVESSSQLSLQDLFLYRS